MGLFDVFRRKPTPPTTPTTSPTPSTSSTLPASAPSTPAAPESSGGAAPAADFDALVEAMRRNETGGVGGAEQRFWNAVFRLERLHFYSSKPPAKIIADNDAAPPLFIGLSDGRPMLHVFTDSKRAHAFGAERQEVQGTLQQGVTVLELPTEHAIKHLLSLPRQVGHLLVNGVFFGGRENIVWLYALSRGLSMTDACKRIGVPPWESLAVRFQATGAPEHLDELLCCALKEPRWYSVRKSGEPTPAVFSQADGAEPFFLLATSAELAAATIAALSPGENNLVIGSPPAEMLTLLRQARPNGACDACMFYGTGTFPIPLDRAASIASKLGPG
jgi:hypothetical protein